MKFQPLNISNPEPTKEAWWRSVNSTVLLHAPVLSYRQVLSQSPVSKLVVNFHLQLQSCDFKFYLQLLSYTFKFHLQLLSYTFKFHLQLLSHTFKFHLQLLSQTFKFHLQLLSYTFKFHLQLFVHFEVSTNLSV